MLTRFITIFSLHFFAIFMMALSYSDAPSPVAKTEALTPQPALPQEILASLPDNLRFDRF